MNVAPKPQILVADDQEEIVALVAMNLTEAGFSVVESHDGVEALEKVRLCLPALVILDLMMPNLSGTEVLRAIKRDQRTSSIPVIVLTARRDEIDCVLAFELGADDYVIKPFSPRELVLRVKSILSRSSSPVTVTLFSLGKITLDTERHEISAAGKPVDVTAMEFKLLSALMQRGGRVFSREELVSSIWGIETEIDLRTIDTHLRRLRDKLGPAGSQIQTVRGVGYRLSAS